MGKVPEETQAVRLRLVCQTPPPTQHEGRGTEFGRQDKHQAIHPGDARTDGSNQYELDVYVRQDRRTDALHFLGPWVHGTATAPFLYLSWRWTEPEPSHWIKRLKIPLTSIIEEQTDGAGRQCGIHLEAMVSGAGGWTVPRIGVSWTAVETRNAGT